MKSKTDDIVQTLDNLIRKGEGERARAELLKLNITRVPKELRVKIAALACRADLPELTVRILNPIVSPSQGTPSSATEDEKAEYAMGLIYLGAVNEGMRFLKDLSSDKNPRVLLYRALGYFAQWNHKEAIELLQKAETSTLSNYQKLVCRVNLSAALVHERRFSEALPLLERLKVETAEKSFPLHGSVVKYWAELKIETRDFKEAHKLLKGAEQAFEHFGGTDGLLIRKWKAIVDLIESEASIESRNAIHAIKDEAREKQRWETVRDCDFYKAIYTHNKTTFLRLYFGTPFPSYRERILKEWKEPLDLPDTFDWHLKKSKKMPELRLLFGDKLKVGQSLHRLLSALSSDFYRPFRLPELFAMVHPEEHYNPVSSPVKMHALLARLKLWLHDNKQPITVMEDERKYHLSALAPCTLLVPRDRERQPSAQEHALRKLEDHFKTEFAISAASKVLQLSADSALEIVNKALQEGQLIRVGKGRATRYQFVSLKTLKAA